MSDGDKTQVVAADSAANEVNAIAVVESGTARFGAMLSPDVPHVARSRLHEWRRYICHEGYESRMLSFVS
jgi:hypothetical protein